jgi:membrane-anchored protein YejM (alkaline phosphatase superfamily)
MWLFNVALAAFVGLAYLDGESLPQVAHVRVFAYLGLVSTLATLALVPQAFLWLAARTDTGQRIYPTLQAVVWMLFQLAIIVDTRVWGLFRYHFNSAAWNLITSKGSEDSYRLGASVWLVAGGLALALGLVQTFVWRMLCRWGAPRPFVEGESRFARHARPLRRPAWIVATLVLLAVCVEKSIYASAELARDPHVAAVSRAFPLYPRVSVMPMLPEPLAGEVASGYECVVFREGATLDYPHARPVLAPGIARPNVLILVVDSWRADSLDVATTPRLEQFSHAARRFADHSSGGNGTRFGVFSMLYGLHGSYWWPVLEAGASPVLLDTLLEAGYDARVFSAASMDYPEFRRTAWARIPERVHDDFGELRSSERDRLAAQACAEWWRTRDAAQPFFAFVLLDSAHQQYDFPRTRRRLCPTRVTSTTSSSPARATRTRRTRSQPLPQRAAARGQGRRRVARRAWRLWPAREHAGRRHRRPRRGVRRARLLGPHGQLHRLAGAGPADPARPGRARRRRATPDDPRGPAGDAARAPGRGPGPAPGLDARQPPARPRPGAPAGRRRVGGRRAAHPRRDPARAARASRGPRCKCLERPLAAPRRPKTGPGSPAEALGRLAAECALFLAP